MSVFLVSAVSVCSAQNPSGKNDFWSHMRYGGNIGLGFNQGGFNASVSPSAIYRFDRRFAAGTAVTFNYAKYGDARRIAYGASLLSLYNPLPYLQLSAEFEQLRINYKFENLLANRENNYWSPALFFGLGYTQQYFTIGIRYDVLYDSGESIYANAWMPFVRIYF
ncbi:alpha-ketoglutarate decarboxylase [Pricia sp. S334]|uniref:Alpha-ketoglutarate decarboxylase n=1 Tax=Pricia mediterranea TaxID=3076079 RepID=A0ABU3L8P4_9FLAO|nr:alpha-ketoglutarate decarboxylase [Pricia sp. S334]MDT7829437.1 alpha-ketoglutarate decarboxylase [Pricia sp. S334]